MKLMAKNKILDYVNYQWKMEEVKSEKDCLKLALSACKLGDLIGVECRGYSDMDTHENVATFKTQKEFATGLDAVKKIDADRVQVSLRVGKDDVDVTFGPCANTEDGNWVTVYGKEELVKKISAEIQKLVG